MGYDDREPPPADHPGPGFLQLAGVVLVRLVGLAVLFLGLWIAAKVLFESWALYQEPARIERFADAIEHGSNLDKTFSAAVDRAIATDVATNGVTEAADEPRIGADESVAPAPDGGKAGARRGASLRLSYFAAWIIVLLLLLIVGSLAMSAITTGGQLALYDMQVKRFSREVVREIARARGS